MMLAGNVLHSRGLLYTDPAEMAVMLGPILGPVAKYGILLLMANAAILGATAISLGTVFVFLQYVQRFNQPIQQISIMWTNIQNAIAGGERIFGLLDEQPDLTDKPTAIDMPSIVGKVIVVSGAL